MNNKMDVVQVGGTSLTVRSSYRSVKVIGRGSYGVVVSVSNGEEKLAVKRVKPVAQQASDAKHALREIRCMRLLGNHANIVKLRDLYGFDDELYIVMELMDSDLHRIIQSPQDLTEAHHRFFMYQLVRGVKYMHDQGIIHRDLKPGNLLVTRNCELKITDFGLARLQTRHHHHHGGSSGSEEEEEEGEPMTQHVVTRWYRPPELMLTPDGKYSNAVDMWSVGCVLAELLGRKPFFPGKNFVHQLQLIFNVIGAPRPCEISNVRNRQARKFLDSVKSKPKVAFSDIFPTPKHSREAASVLECLLVFKPAHRMSARALLENHPYFDNLSYAKKPILDPVPPRTDFSFEHTTQLSRLKDEIDKEIKHPPRRHAPLGHKTAKIIPTPPPPSHPQRQQRRALSITNYNKSSSSTTTRSSSGSSSLASKNTTKTQEHATKHRVPHHHFNTVVSAWQHEKKKSVSHQ